MKNLSFIILLISIPLYISSCSQKLPVPVADGTGILVIPTTSRNFTPNPYGYYYNFLYSPETKVQIKVVPLGSRNFMIIDGFPPGNYEISGIRSISSVGTGNSFAHVSAETTAFSRSIPIEIRSEEITLLNYMFSVEQKFYDPNIVFRYSQGFYFKPLDESQHKQVVSDLKNLPNAEQWKLTQAFVASTTDQDKGVTSSNELQLTWNPRWSNN